MADIDELLEPSGAPTVDPSPPSSDVPEKREALAILASLGETKDFIGVEMSLGDITKLSTKDVQKYFNRYQAAMSSRVTDGLVKSAIKLASRAISIFLPIDDVDRLCVDLQGDELVNRELSNFAGLLVLKGGRFVALASGLFQVAKHVEIKAPNTVEKTETPATRDEDGYPLSGIDEVPG